MKKRFTAFAIAFSMLIGQAAGMIAYAEDGQNEYGHNVTYKPITQLYTGGKPIKFFDSKITEWGNLDENIVNNEANSIKWLSENDYLLNRFGKKYSEKEYTPGCFNSKGEWLTQLKGPTNVNKWYANVSFDILSEKSQRENGNISNVYDKGDLQYFFSWKVKTVQTKWGLFDKSNDTGITTALGESTYSSGGGWKKYNTYIDGPNLGNNSAWKPGTKLKYISFSASSDKDNRVDSYLSGAMLVGRDIHGPKINSVKVTTDKEGTNEIENGTITLDTIDSLTNRTVYFRVEWDEPVVFDGMSQRDIAKLALSVKTIGIDGTSGMDAEAQFFEFAPSKNDAKPVMIFEYKIADPYTDTLPIAQERGYYYKFSSVTVSKNENGKLWDNIYDISGNKFAADENGIQSENKVTTPVGGLNCVDLMPFGIKNIRMTKELNDGGAFIKAGELLGVTVELNKEFAGNIKTEDLPSITLNLKDPDGERVTIKPSDSDLKKKAKYSRGWDDFGYYYNGSVRMKNAALGNDSKSITYYVQLYPGYKLDDGEKTIKVTALSTEGRQLKDSSGYSLMNYSLDGDMLAPIDIPAAAESKKSIYSAAPDKQYKIDYEVPQVELSVSSIESDVVSLTASIEDNSLNGCDATFTVKADGTALGEGMSFQTASSESYKESKWQKGEEGSLIALFGAPIVDGKAYGFIKLPQNCEAYKIIVNAVVVDEAENSTETEKEISLNFDSLAPRLKAYVKDEKVDVEISDMDDNVTYYYGFSDNESNEPQYNSEKGKNGTIDAPDLPDGNKIHTKVLWIKADDSHNNVSDVSKITVNYDRTYADISYTADTEKEYIAGDYPAVDFTVTKPTSYWYMWAEKPANVSDTSTFVKSDIETELKKRAEKYGYTGTTEESGSVELNADSMVAIIDSESETYGGDAKPSKTTRPIMLVIAADKEDGDTVVKTIEFNTYYAAPKVTVKQNRFSTNDSSGQRIDYIRSTDKNTLLLASDTDKYTYPLNTPSLYGFAQAEFSIVPDPVTELKRIDTDNSFVTLERVVYYGNNLEGHVADRKEIGRWNFSEIGLGGASDSAVINIDPKYIDASYRESFEDENGFTSNYSVRYEFVCNMSYTGGSIAATATPITYFAFNNEPTAFIYEASVIEYEYSSTSNHFMEYEKQNTEAVFDKNGNDVTANVPIYTVKTIEEIGINSLSLTDENESGGVRRGAYIRFSPSSYYEDGYCDAAFYGAPVINMRDEKNTAKMVMHIGTDPNNLSDTLNFISDGYNIQSEFYDVGQYILNDDEKIGEVKLYYCFEYPERGTNYPVTSPKYVMIIRRDDSAPVFDFYVSETDRRTNEVRVKLNALYDMQTASDGTTVVDTTETELRNNEYFYFAAFQRVTKSEYDGLPDYERRMYYSYGEETGYKYYAEVHPDNDGTYRFTSNGFIEPRAVDKAGNYNETVMVNGEKKGLKYLESGMDFPVYAIENITTEPPKFTENPTFTQEDGRFKVTAKADSSVKNVYLKFDKEYSSLLSENNSDSGDMYNINDVPGMFDGEFDSNSGEISAEVYVKPSASLSAVTLVIEDDAGNIAEYVHSFDSAVAGKNAEITNAKKNGYPGYDGTALDFSVPVKIDGMDGGYSLSHSGIAVYKDGVTSVTYTDLFGESKTENIYVNVFGEAFAHELKFSAGGKEITSQTKVNTDIKVTIDTAATKDLSVDGGTDEFTFAENGNLNYSLTNSKVGKTKNFSVPITNIDKTVPKPLVSVNVDKDYDSGKIYSVTYFIEGFDKEDVTMIPTESGAAPSSVTFDKASESKKYTFRFRDEAGNEGEYTADASEVNFEDRTEKTITNYRLTYMVPSENGFRTIGEFDSGASVDIGLVNRPISVKVEALNKNGEVVPAVISANGDLPKGTAVYPTEKIVVFADESSEERTVEVTVAGNENSQTAKIVLPSNTIDMTAPTGTVNYKADGNTVKAYLVTNDTDLAENGIYVTGTKSDGTALELKKDENGYYTEFDINGTGRFVMYDKAGNVGNITIAVLTIDTNPPTVVSEGWQSIYEAKEKTEIETLLKIPTNNSIKLFITFNEQLSRAEVKAFGAGSNSAKPAELTPTDDYVVAATSGNTLTVEFKQNCQAMLTVYDLRNNPTTLWRPEDGPITVIDRDVPKLAEGYPKIVSTDNNEVTLEYVFADKEAVMFLQAPKAEREYKNKHTVTFKENGTKILNFADKAGNVFTDYPVITGIDELAPHISMSVDYVGSGKELSGNDSYTAGNLYTSRDVRILICVKDDNPEDVTVTAKTKSGKSVKVNKEDVVKEYVVKDKKTKTTYNYNFVVSENGAYTVTAKDKWNNETTVETSVSVIDKTAPTISFSENSLVVKVGEKEESVKDKIINNTAAVDLQSGANKPMGDKKVTAKNGVTVEVDLSDVKLDKEGKYFAKVKAYDRLKNSSEKEYRVIVLKDVYTFSVNGTSVYANDVYTTAKGKIKIQNANETAKYYYSKGYKTLAQMKYAKGFDANTGFEASQNGYYTILAQEEGRKMYLLYVYVN